MPSRTGFRQLGPQVAVPETRLSIPDSYKKDTRLNNSSQEQVQETSTGEQELTQQHTSPSPLQQQEQQPNGVEQK